MREESLPKFTPEERDILRELWPLIDASTDEANTAVREEASKRPEFAAVLAQEDPARTEARQRQDRERLRAALTESAWAPYLGQLKRDGAGYAVMGIEFRAWYPLLGAYRRVLVHRLVEARDADATVFVSRLDVLDRFLDVLMSTLAEAYIDTKEQLIQQSKRRLQRYTVALERTNAELDQFAYVASHDLKAPLRDVDNLAKWIVEDAGELVPEPSKAHLSKLQDRVRRMETFLDELLEYSRAGRIFAQSEQIDVVAILQDVLPLIGCPSTFDISIPDRGPELTTPRAPLMTVLRNLIGNAIKHHDRDFGTVTVDVSPEGDELVRFTVRDDGPGIPREFHDRIFAMFQTLRPRDEVEGSGMGLALVKKLVEAHGGAITVDSGQGRGCAFSFTWPRQWMDDGED